MPIELTVATGRYAHVEPLARRGELAGVPEPVALRWHFDRPRHIFHAAASPEAPFDVAEMALSTVFALADRGDRRYVALPVFPSRMFRHGSIYVGPSITEPRDLEGARVGTVRYPQTASVWVRALLAERFGISPRAIEWWVSEPLATIPPGLRCQVVAGGEDALHARFAAGELDALISVRVPAAVAEGRARRLFTDVAGEERAALAEQGFVPLMHTLVLRASLAGAYPWLAHALVRGFQAASQEALDWLADEDASSLPVPFQHTWVEEAARLAGGDPWPEGLEGNRRALARFAGHLLDQGLISRPLSPDEVFSGKPRYQDG